MKKKINILLLSLCFVQILKAQDTLLLSMNEIILMAQDNSPNSQIAVTRFKNSFWQYQSFLSNYKPQINLNATVPNLNRSIGIITLPDGSNAFIEQRFSSTDANISLQQAIGWTGGSVFVSTGLQRIDIFSDPRATSWRSVPVSVGFSQPLFSFNALKWDKKTEPLRYVEAEKGYSEAMERVAFDAVSLFFDAYIGQLSWEAAQKDKANADTLYRISQGRFEVGKIAETELLQIEVAQMNADAALAQASLDVQNGAESLRNFLGLKNAVFFQLTPPSEMPDIVINPLLAVSYALKYRSDVVRFERQLLEADRGTEQADRANGIDIEVVASIGLSQTGGTLPSAFQSPLDQEQLSVRLQLPIVNWGRAEAQRQIAASNRDLAQRTVAQDQLQLEREVSVKVQQFSLVRQQAVLALKTFEVNQKTYDLSKNRYLIGRISVTDLNLAQTNLDRSRRNYMTALRNFWVAYYEIRLLTLYDFLEEKPLLQEISPKDK